MVKGIRETIAEKKKDVIREKLEDQTFQIDSEVMTILSLNMFSDDNDMVVTVVFGKQPDCVIPQYAILTKAEARELKIYEDAYCAYLESWGKEDRQKAIAAASKLKDLKHGYSLTEWRCWNILLTDACQEDFFKYSGLKMGSGKGFLLTPWMLEDYIIDE